MFNMNHVSAVYSGRKGCACGCRGKYTYATAEARPSYMTGDEGVNPRMVKMMTAKVEKMVREGRWVARVHVDRDGEYFAVDMENDRTYTVYFRKPEGAACFMATSG